MCIVIKSNYCLEAENYRDPDGSFIYKINIAPKIS